MNSSGLFLLLYPPVEFKQEQMTCHQDTLSAYFFSLFLIFNRKLCVEILIALCYDEGDRKDLKN